MTVNEEWHTPALEPNLRWLYKHSGTTVQLRFNHAVYTVTVEREENSAIGDGSPSSEAGGDNSGPSHETDGGSKVRDTASSDDGDADFMFEIGDGGDAP
jgi:hypothetical protein